MLWQEVNKEKALLDEQIRLANRHKTVSYQRSGVENDMLFLIQRIVIRKFQSNNQKLKTQQSNQISIKMYQQLRKHCQKFMHRLLQKKFKQSKEDLIKEMQEELTKQLIEITQYQFQFVNEYDVDLLNKFGQKIYDETPAPFLFELQNKEEQVIESEKERSDNQTTENEAKVSYNIVQEVSKDMILKSRSRVFNEQERFQREKFIKTNTPKISIENNKLMHRRRNSTSIFGFESSSTLQALYDKKQSFQISETQSINTDSEFSTHSVVEFQTEKNIPFTVNTTGLFNNNHVNLKALTQDNLNDKDTELQKITENDSQDLIETIQTSGIQIQEKPKKTKQKESQNQVKRNRYPIIVFLSKLLAIMLINYVVFRGFKCLNINF